MSSTSIDRQQVEQLVRQIVQRVVVGQTAANPSVSAAPKLVVSISARHVHLTDEHVERLFGKGRTLTPGENDNDSPEKK